MAAHRDYSALLRNLRSAMGEAEIDPADAEAVRDWLRRVCGNAVGAPARAVQRPAVLPPVLLPRGAELASLARRSHWLWDVVRLRDWVAQRRPVLVGGLLQPGDAAHLAAELGIRPEAAADRGAVDGSDPGVLRIWDAARAAGAVTLGPQERVVHPEELEDSDAAVLRRWLAVFDCAVGFDENRGRRDPRERLAYGAAEQCLASLLFGMYAQRGGPVRMMEAVTRLLQDALGDTLPAADRAHVRTRAFAAVRNKLTRLIGHGVIKRGPFGDYELTPLGLWGMNRRLVKSGYVAPVRGAYRSCTATTLLVALASYSERERAEEFEQWRDARGDAAAAEELLGAAARMAPEDRSLAMALLRRLGSDAQPAIRAGLRDPSLGPHCRSWLVARGLQPRRELSGRDRAWLLVDEVVAAARYDSPEEFLRGLPRLVGQRERALFPDLAGLDHPDAPEALRLLFELHPDPEVTAMSGWLLSRSA